MKKLISIILIACLMTPYQPVMASDLSAEASPQTQAKAEYIIGPYDTLDIQILNHSELSAKATITPDGQISLPLLGFVEVQGKTLRSLDSFLTEQYSAYIQDPHLVINLTPKPIYVVQYDRKKLEWDVKTAKSVDEAKAFAGPNQLATIEYGGVYKVDSGKQPDWWEDNWYKVLTATAVVVGVISTTRKW